MTLSKKFFILLFLGLFSKEAYSQVKVGDNPTVINSSALFEMESSSLGLLMPRMTTVERDAILSPANGLVIFNTTTVTIEQNMGTPSAPVWNSLTASSLHLTNAIVPAGLAVGQIVLNTNASSGLLQGPVWWDGSKWSSLVPITSPTTTQFTDGAPSGIGEAGILYVDSATNSPTLGNQYVWDGSAFVSYAEPSGTPFTLQGNNEDAKGDKLAPVYRDGIVGIGSTQNTEPSAQLDVNSTTRGFLPPRMTELQMKDIVSPADGLIVYCTDCKPRGVYLYDTAKTINPSQVNGWGPLGNQTLGDATFVGSTINCTGTLAGTYSLGVPMTSTNTKIITINVATIGRFSATTDTVNGVVFSATGTLLTTGAGTQVILRATGAPSNGGTFNYNVYIGGQTCVFAVTFAAPATFNCNASFSSRIIPYTDVLVNGQSYTGTFTVPYTAGNNTAYAAITIASNGLTLTRVAGTYASGGGNILYNLTGTYTGETGPYGVFFTTPEGCTAQFNGMKFSTIANAGQIVRFEEFVFNLPTAGNRSLQIATASGTASFHGGGYFSWVGGSASVEALNLSVTTTLARIVPGWGFTAAGDNQVMFLRNTANNRYYRAELIVGPGYNNNQIRIERLDTTSSGSSVATAVVNAGTAVTLGNINVELPTSGNRSLRVSTGTGSMVITRGSFGTASGGAYSHNGVGFQTINTSYSYLTAGANFLAQGGYQRLYMLDTINSEWYKIELVVGAGYNNNLVRIERVTDAVGYRITQAANRGVDVTLDNLRGRLNTSTTNNNLQLATVAGAMGTQGATDGHFSTSPGAYTTFKNNTTTLNTSFITYGHTGWSYNSAGDHILAHVRDTNTGKFYRAVLVIGGGFRKNMVMIERY